MELKSVIGLATWIVMHVATVRHAKAATDREADRILRDHPATKLSMEAAAQLATIV